MKLFVPGRICLVGEHSDWAGGYRRINAEIEKGYTLITGTDTGSELINNLAPLLTAVGVILVIVFAFITIGRVKKGDY